MSSSIFANEKDFLEVVLSRIKEYIGSSKDKDLAAALGAAASTLSTWRARGDVPYDYIVKFAIGKDVSLDWLFYGGPHEMADSMVREDAPAYEVKESSDDHRTPLQAAAILGRMFVASINCLPEQDRNVVLTALWGEGVAYDIIHGPYEEVTALRPQTRAASSPDKKTGDAS